LDKQKIHETIVIMQKTVGKKFVKPLVVFKKPFEAIPKITAKIKYIYPDTIFII